MNAIKHIDIFEHQDNEGDNSRKCPIQVNEVQFMDHDGTPTKHHAYKTTPYIRITSCTSDPEETISLGQRNENNLMEYHRTPKSHCTNKATPYPDLNSYTSGSEEINSPRQDNEIDLTGHNETPKTHRQTAISGRFLSKRKIDFDLCEDCE